MRELLRGGGRLPVKFTRPEVAEVLRAHYAAGNGNGNGHGTRERQRGRDTDTGRPAAPAASSSGSPASRARARAPSPRPLKARLADERAVEILDGDEVRTYLSKGLGFSKEDRDTNIRRIGYVARLLARNGVPVITAAISPYREVRDEVRRLAAEDGMPFVEVFASASIEALVARDVKGLYKKALAGEVRTSPASPIPTSRPRSAEVVGPHRPGERGPEPGPDPARARGAGAARAAKRPGARGRRPVEARAS